MASGTCSVDCAALMSTMGASMKAGLCQMPAVYRDWYTTCPPPCGAVDKLSGIRIDYLHAHKDAILTLHSGGYIYRGVETLLDGPSSSSTGSDSGGDPQWFTTAVLVHKMDPKVARNKDPYGR